mmetsp:Transcript_111973/g.267134  ORF Transcript_111973/g.267134 Transcript_111973/m.267134 type:complete len:217 (+) Transcript_111973:1-651(+)
MRVSPDSRWFEGHCSTSTNSPSRRRRKPSSGSSGSGESTCFKSWKPTGMESSSWEGTAPPFSAEPPSGSSGSKFWVSSGSSKTKFSSSLISISGSLLGSPSSLSTFSSSSSRPKVRCKYFLSTGRSNFSVSCTSRRILKSARQSWRCATPSVPRSVMKPSIPSAMKRHRTRQTFIWGSSAGPSRSSATSSGFAWRRLLVPVTCSSEVMGPSLTTLK